MGEAACCSSAASEAGSWAGFAFWEAAAWMTKPSDSPTSLISFEFSSSWPAQQDTSLKFAFSAQPVYPLWLPISASGRQAQTASKRGILAPQEGHAMCLYLRGKALLLQGLKMDAHSLSA